MANKVLMITNYTGQNIPKEGIERFDQVFLITEKQESIPILVVEQLLRITSETGVKFSLLPIDAKSNEEFLVYMSFEVFKMWINNNDIQITLLSNNTSLDNLVSIATANGIKLSRADASNSKSNTNYAQKQESLLQPKTLSQSTISPSVVKEEVRPKTLSSSSTSFISHKKTQAEQPTKAQVLSTPQSEEQNTEKNKKLIASLLNQNK